jgi:hypothetical protein
MKQIKMLLMLLAFAAGFPFQQRAAAQIAVPNSVLANGGAVLSDSSYRVIGTVGQPLIGMAQNPPSVNSVGFWYLPKQTLMTDVEQLSNAVPTEYRLEQNYPNPFNPTTTIRFALPEQAVVTLKIFDILGREVATLMDEKLEAGVHKVVFDARGLPSGVYIYQLRAGSFVQQKKLALVK